MFFIDKLLYNVGYLMFFKDKFLIKYKKYLLKIFFIELLFIEVLIVFYLFGLVVKF